MWTRESDRPRRSRTGTVLLVGGAVLAATALVGCTSEAPVTASSGAAVGADVESQGLGSSDAALEPGLYKFPVDSAPVGYRVPLVSVPEGFVSILGGFGVRSGNWGTDDARVLYVWDVDSISAHPCQAGVAQTQVGPTAADLADALAAQPMRSGTDPVPVTVDGFDGFYVELSVPDDVDVEACPGGKFNSWPGRWQQAAGQVDMLWILDVDGQRMVFDASHAAGVDGQQLTELKNMVTSTTFAPADGA